MHLPNLLCSPDLLHTYVCTGVPCVTIGTMLTKIQIPVYVVWTIYPMDVCLSQSLSTNNIVYTVIAT